MRKLQSANILTALEAHPAFRAANTVLLYHSLNDEVDTHEFIQKWSNKKRILLPVVVGDDLELRIYTGPENMSICSVYGIEEPTGEAFTDYAAIDFIVVPGVAFDAKGNRLGRGKGYYDRYFAERKTVKLAGCAYGCQITDKLPVDAWDIRMNLLCSESGIVWTDGEKNF